MCLTFTIKRIHLIIKYKTALLKVAGNKLVTKQHFFDVPGGFTVQR